MSEGRTYNFNLEEKRCAECGKKTFVADSGLCLPCTTRAISGLQMKSAIGQAVQKRGKQRMAEFEEVADV